MPHQFTHRPATTTTSRRRWPLLAIGASAGTATWSGWVGLGQYTGFGEIHPLPGIADAVTINTAVTLPIGVEAYAMYALSIATSSRTLPTRTRRYAWASSAAALVLGMAGQVAYHVINARHPATQRTTQTGLAPWWVIALVSCLPVLVLGAASLLWHLAGSDDTESPPAASETVASLPDPEWSQPAAASPVTGHHARLVTTDPSPVTAEAVTVVTTTPVAPDVRRPSEASLERAAQARPEDVSRLLAAVASGALPPSPGVRQVRAHLAISSAHAANARAAVLATPAAADGEPCPHIHQPDPHSATARNSESSPLEKPKRPLQQSPTDTNQKAEPPPEPFTSEEPIQKDQETQTYAVALT